VSDDEDRKSFAGFMSLETGTVTGFYEHVDVLRILWKLENLLSNCVTNGYEEELCCVQIASGSAWDRPYILNICIVTTLYLQFCKFKKMNIEAHSILLFTQYQPTDIFAQYR
jgi:hypothetical protein